MRYAEYYIGDNLDGPYTQYQLDVCPPLLDQDIPAWSLHRMWEFICNRKKYESKEGDEYPNIYLNDDCVIVENPKSIWARHNFCSPRGVYENVINCIEWLIKEGYFNKKYLVNQAEIEEHCKGVLEYLDYIKGEEE